MKNIKTILILILSDLIVISFCQHSTLLINSNNTLLNISTFWHTKTPPLNSSLTLHVVGAATNKTLLSSCSLLPPSNTSFTGKAVFMFGVNGWYVFHFSVSPLLVYLF